MRFTDLSQETVQCLWDKWKYLVRELLDEFNEDVFHGNGIVRENSYREKSYLLLETKQGCLYIFPLPGPEFVLRVYRDKVERDALSLSRMASPPSQEKFIGGMRLDIGIIEERHGAMRVVMHEYLEEALRLTYKRHWVKLLY